MFALALPSILGFLGQTSSQEQTAEAQLQAQQTASISSNTLKSNDLLSAIVVLSFVGVMIYLVVRK